MALEGRVSAATELSEDALLLLPRLRIPLNPLAASEGLLETRDSRMHRAHTPIGPNHQRGRQRFLSVKKKIKKRSQTLKEVQCVH